MAPRAGVSHYPGAVAPGAVPLPAPVVVPVPAVLTLPTTWWGWSATGALVAVALYAALMVLGGRIGAGILPVVGNSMGQDVPWGSHVLVLPLSVRDGDLAVARVGGYKNADNTDDREPAVVVKTYDHRRLVSTADATIYGVGEYELLGRVVAVLPVQRVFRWLDKGAATPGVVRSEKEQAEIDDRKTQRELARLAVEAAKGLVGERQVFLGPAETRSTEETIPVPQGTVRVAWEMRTPPLMPGGEVVATSEGKTATQTVPPDDLPVKGGMKIGGSQLRLAVSEGAAACCTLRFYSK